MRIAVAGFQHETNTFATSRADYKQFLMSKDWPGLCSGADMLDRMRGVHLPIVGAIDRFKEYNNLEVVPLTWCFAMPSGFVTDEAFEKISALICKGLKKAGPVDAVYLDLHGAMVTESIEDAEGELLARLRDITGFGLPIVCSLDYHANITPKMVDLSDFIEVYRTYPHIDMAKTGYRAADVLLTLMQTNSRFKKELRKTDYLIPLNMGCTTIEPCKSLVEGTIATYRENLRAGEHVSFAAGFGLSDIEHAGPTLLCYGQEEGRVKSNITELFTEIIETEDKFSGIGLPAKDAVAKALQLSVGASKPIILADTQDNPGAGGSGDTTGLLRALLDADDGNPIIGVISDAISAKASHDAGVGAEVFLSLGGKGFTNDEPVCQRFKILALGDGKFTGTGPMWKGAKMELGPCALVSLGAVRVVVASKTVQAGDQSMFRHLGIEPKNESIVALKSSVHFRADFAPIASEILIALAPGPVTADPRLLSYKNLRSGVRVGPGLPIR
jgi:microcystin degradation protein MlrC